MTAPQRPFLTWQEAVLACEVSPASVLAALDAVDGLGPEVPTLLGGSVATGLAHGRSDLDIYAIVDDLGGQVAGPIQRVGGLGAKVDLKLVRGAFLEELLQKVEGFRAGGCVDVTLAESLSEWDRVVLHRVLGGLPIRGAAWQQRTAARMGDALVRHKVLCALAMVKRRQVTAEALRRAGDWLSLLFVARDVVDAAADLLLAAAGDSGVAPKWRVRQLDRIWSASWPPVAGPGGQAAFPGRPLPAPVRTYLTLSTFPTEVSPASALDFARRAVGWSRSVVLFAGCALDGLTGLLASRPAPRWTGEVPALALDVHLAVSDGRFAVKRLGEAADGWEISAEAASMLCLFDGAVAGVQHGREGPPPSADLLNLAAFARGQGLLDSESPAPLRSR